MGRRNEKRNVMSERIMENIMDENDVQCDVQSLIQIIQIYEIEW
jgi:hypothetical protein